MQHQAADFSRRVIAEVSRADTSELVYLLSAFGGQSRHDLEAPAIPLMTQVGSRATHLLSRTRPPLCHQAVLNCSPRAERWFDEATARRDTASANFPAELRARYRNLSLRMCLGKLRVKCDQGSRFLTC
jgi:hypothetical protein